MGMTGGSHPPERGSSPRRVTRTASGQRSSAARNDACRVGPRWASRSVKPVSQTCEVRLLGSAPRRSGATESMPGFEPGDGGSNPPSGTTHAVGYRLSAVGSPDSESRWLKADSWCVHSGVAQVDGHLLVTETCGGSSPPAGATGVGLAGPASADRRSAPMGSWPNRQGSGLAHRRLGVRIPLTPRKTVNGRQSTVFSR